jgi:membrane protein
VEEGSGGLKRREGGSVGIVRWVERVEHFAPIVAAPVGFGATVYARFARHRGSVLAGGLAYFALLSLVPSLLSLGALVAFFYNPADFVSDVRHLLADRTEALATMKPFLDGIGALSDTSVASLGVAGLVSVWVSLYAASRFVYVGRQVLDITLEQEPRPPSLWSRAIAVLITLATQVGIVLGVLILTLLPRVFALLGEHSSVAAILPATRIPLLLIVVYLLLTASMRFGTSARGSVSWLNLGAAIGTAAILIGTFGLSKFLTYSATYSQIVALLGGAIALQLWLYIVGTVIVGSAEIEGVRCGFQRRDGWLPRDQA